MPTPTHWTTENTNFTLTNNNYTAEKTANDANIDRIEVNHGFSSGKHYFEISLDSTTARVIYLGVAEDSTAFTVAPGWSSESYGVYCNTGDAYNNSSSVSCLSGIAEEDIIGIALNLDDGEIYYSKNGTWASGSNPSTGTNPAHDNLTGTKIASASIYTINEAITIYTAAADLTYTAPTGYTSGLLIPDTEIDDINMGIGLGISSDFTMGLSANTGIGLGISTDVNTFPVEGNVGIKLGVSAKAATQSVQSNIGIGFGTSVILNPYNSSNINCGIGLGVQSITAPQRLALARIGIGLGSTIKVMKPTFTTIETGIGLGILTTGLTHTGIQSNVGIRLGGSMDVDNNGNITPTYPLPEFSNDRWC